jgi:predicted DNA-binding transcriptional regulator AlpA
MKQERAPELVDSIQLIRKKPLCKQIGLSEWTLDRKIKRGEFPKPIWLGPTTPAWKLSEVEAWQNDPARRVRPQGRIDHKEQPKPKAKPRKIERQRLKVRP